MNVIIFSKIVLLFIGCRFLNLNLIYLAILNLFCVEYTILIEIIDLEILESVGNSFLIKVKRIRSDKLLTLLLFKSSNNNSIFHIKHVQNSLIQSIFSN